MQPFSCRCGSAVSCRSSALGGRFQLRSMSLSSTRLLFLGGRRSGVMFVIRVIVVLLVNQIGQSLQHFNDDRLISVILASMHNVGQALCKYQRFFELRRFFGGV